MEQLGTGIHVVVYGTTTQTLGSSVDTNKTKEGTWKYIGYHESTPVRGRGDTGVRGRRKGRRECSVVQGRDGVGGRNKKDTVESQVRGVYSSQSFCCFTFGSVRGRTISEGSRK